MLQAPPLAILERWIAMVSRPHISERQIKPSENRGGKLTKAAKAAAEATAKSELAITPKFTPDPNHPLISLAFL